MSDDAALLNLEAIRALFRVDAEGRAFRHVPAMLMEIESLRAEVDRLKAEERKRGTAYQTIPHRWNVPAREGEETPIPERSLSHEAMVQIAQLKAHCDAASIRAEKAEAEVDHLRAVIAESDRTSVLQAVLDAIKGTLDPSMQIADHPNVKFAQMQRLKWEAQGGIAPRVLELARHRAAYLHNISIGRDGHCLGTDTCPHPDCQAVR